MLARPRAAALLPTIALAIGVLTLIGIFWPECRAAVRVWYDSTAYGHCFLVLPIALYLAWDRRDALRGIAPEPTAAFALLGFPLALAWLVAERLGIMEGRQLVGIAALEVLFLCVLGWRLFRALSGPLLYLVFLVPFGAFLTYPLQVFTAWFIEVGLNVAGIPHFITDMTIEIAAGTFFVAEACAGLRFLIASVAFGVFFALLNYNSPGRRAGFIAASIIVPIIANGIRALGIVVLGSILGSAQAAAADHLVYGWFFFSAVTLLLVLAGLPFREAVPSAPVAVAGSRRASGVAFARVAGAAVGIAALGPAVALALARNAPPARLTGLPALIAPEGCSLGANPATRADRAAWTLTCADRTWTIDLQALPGRSTGDVLSEVRRTLVGPVDADEATNAGVDHAPGWQTTLAREPSVVLGSAAWVDGRPALGGLAQRVSLARSSVSGAPVAPIVMAVSWRPGQPQPEGTLLAARDELIRFIHAQPDLAGELAKVSARD